VFEMKLTPPVLAPADTTMGVKALGSSLNPFPLSPAPFQNSGSKLMSRPAYGPPMFASAATV